MNVDTDIPIPKWIYELVDQLVDLKEFMVAYGGTKLRKDARRPLSAPLLLIVF